MSLADHIKSSALCQFVAYYNPAPALNQSRWRTGFHLHFKKTLGLGARYNIHTISCMSRTIRWNGELFISWLNCDIFEGFSRKEHYVCLPVGFCESDLTTVVPHSPKHQPIEGFALSPPPIHVSDVKADIPMMELQLQLGNKVMHLLLVGFYQLSGRTHVAMIILKGYSV